MTNIDLIKEKLKNVKDKDGNVICVVDDDLLEEAIYAIQNYTFSEDRIKNNFSFEEMDNEFYRNKVWSSDSNQQSSIGFTEIDTKYDRVSIVYRNNKAESIYFTSIPGLSIKKNVNPDNSSSIDIEGYAFLYHKFDDGITRDCDIDFMVGPSGKINVRQKVSDCDEELRIMERSESMLFFDTFNEFEQYHNDLDKGLAMYSHKKRNISK